MTRQWKTKPVTPGGRLVRQGQFQHALQGAANKIVEHVGAAMDKLQAANDARLTRIEEALGLKPTGPALVEDAPPPLPSPAVMEAWRDVRRDTEALPAPDGAA